MAKCVSCGTENPQNAKFCLSCGSPLEKKCTKCGEFTIMSAKFCPFCGSQFDMIEDVSVIRYKNKLTFYKYLFIYSDYGKDQYIVAFRNNYYQILSPVTAKPVNNDKYEEIDSPSIDGYYRYLPAKKNGKWGVVDPISGAVQIDFIYNKIDSSGWTFRLYDGRYWGSIDASTREVTIPFEYDEITWHSDVKKNGLWGHYYNKKLVIPCEYIDLGVGLSPIRPSQHKNRKWGLMYSDGTVIIPFQYEEMIYSEPFGHSLYYFRNGDKWGLYVSESKKTYPCIYTIDEVHKIKWW